jgi:hypothetical protein
MAMKEPLTLSKSLTEQVLDEMIKNVEIQKEFNNEVTQNLKDLFGRWDKMSVEQIINAIKSDSEVNHETG